MKNDEKENSCQSDSRWDVQYVDYSSQDYEYFKKIRISLLLLFHLKYRTESVEYLRHDGFPDCVRTADFTSNQMNE